MQIRKKQCTVPIMTRSPHFHLALADGALPLNLSSRWNVRPTLTTAEGLNFMVKMTNTLSQQFLSVSCFNQQALGVQLLRLRPRGLSIVT